MAALPALSPALVAYKAHLLQRIDTLAEADKGTKNSTAYCEPSNGIFLCAAAARKALLADGRSGLFAERDMCPDWHTAKPACGACSGIYEYAEEMCEHISEFAGDVVFVRCGALIREAKREAKLAARAAGGAGGGSGDGNGV